MVCSSFVAGTPVHQNACVRDATAIPVSLPLRR